MSLSQAQLITTLVDLEYVFRSSDGETAFATVTVDDHKETWPIRSKGFRRWLVRKFYAIEGKPPAAQAMSDALGAIEARAQFSGHVHDVHVRVAGHEGAIYIDLANSMWEAVEVTASGWRVVSDPPVKFRRPKGMLALPIPTSGGSLADLRQFLNLKDTNTWVLIVSWLVAAARPRGPFPTLVLNGEHGTAKSTTAEALRRLIDPNSAMLRAEPRDARDVMIAANNGWIVALDNISTLQAWTSDALCRLATGGGFSTRTLYSDDDETIFAAERPVILNGIEEIVTRSDLLDRALLVNLPVIEESRRRPARALWAEFEAAHARLLGALLGAVSTALSREGSVKLARLPRMADFALWATAAAPALGWTDETFISVYASNREQAHEVALDASPVASAVRALADRGVAWSGTSSELLAELNKLVDEATRKTRSWPDAARTLGSVLRRLAPNLRAVGVAVTFSDDRSLGARRRQIRIEKVGEADRSQRSDRSHAGFGAAPPFHGNDGPFHGNDAENAKTPHGNNGNDGNDAVPVLSRPGQEPLWGDL